MTQAAIAGEVHEALDVHRRVAAKVTLDRVVGVDGLTDLQDFGVRQVLDTTAVVNAQLVGDVDRGLATDAVDVGERDDYALVGREIDTRDTSHCKLSPAPQGALANGPISKRLISNAKNGPRIRSLRFAVRSACRNGVQLRRVAPNVKRSDRFCGRSKG